MQLVEKFAEVKLPSDIDIQIIRDLATECDDVFSFEEQTDCILVRLPVSWVEFAPPKNIGKVKKCNDSQLNKDFDILYGSYPKKVGKTNGFKRYKAWVTTGRVVNGKRVKLTNSDIWNAIAAYKEQLELNETERKYQKNFDTFMGDSILDYLEDM